MLFTAFTYVVSPENAKNLQKLQTKTPKLLKSKDVHFDDLESNLWHLQFLEKPNKKISPISAS